MIFRIEFANLSESEAMSSLQGFICGDATNLRIATVAGVVTGWATVEDDRIGQMADELDADDNVVFYV